MRKTIIITNVLQCKLCNDLIFSKHVHDYKQCKCGFVSIDGGNEYLKRGYNAAKLKEFFPEGHQITYEEASEYWKDLSTWEEIY